MWLGSTQATLLSISARPPLGHSVARRHVQLERACGHSCSSNRHQRKYYPEQSLGATSSRRLAGWSGSNARQRSSTGCGIQRHRSSTLARLPSCHAASLSSAAPSQRTSPDIDLDWTACLTPLQLALSLLLPAVLCALGVKLAPPAAVTVPYMALCAGVYCSLVWVTQQVLLEWQYGPRQCLATDLADPDSKFLEVAGLQLHTKVADGLAAAGLPLDSKVLSLHCYHGFGANVFSWSFVQKLLAKRLRGLVTAHDQPGFGLTQRPASLSAYQLAFNGFLGRAVLERELAARSFVGAPALKRVLNRHNPSAPSLLSPAPSDPRPQSRVKRVLMGHSLGCLCAALETIGAPQDIEAVVLVAPVIMMPKGRPEDDFRAELAEVPEVPQQPEPVRFEAAAAAGAAAVASSPGKEAGPVDAAAGAGAGVGADQAGSGTGTKAENGAVAAVADEEVSSLEASPPTTPASLSLKSEPFASPASRPRLRRFTSSNNRPREPAVTAVVAAPAAVVGRLLRAVIGVVQATFISVFLAILLPIQPLLLLLLRKMVRSRDFWNRGLAMAYYNTRMVDRSLVDGYCRPRLVSGFDTALLRYVFSRALRGGNMVEYFGACVEGRPTEDHDVMKRLAAVAAAYSLPVLIIHGRDDQIIPVSNSARLAEAFDRAELVVVEGCGHVPHEEHPQAFVDIVANFLDRRVLHASGAEAGQARG